MPFPEQLARTFTRDNILAIEPGLMGCYGLFVNQGRWVYVGSGEIRSRLLDHFNGDNACINGQLPTHYVDVVTSDYIEEEKRLIRELDPICNRKVG